MAVRESIGRFKYIEEDGIDQSYESILSEMKKEISILTSKGAEDDD